MTAVEFTPNPSFKPNLKQNERAHFRIGMFGTASDPVGADRVLVIYGAGHGNLLRRLATDSGVYRVQDPAMWLKPTRRSK